jgi:hypothetical protein
LIVAGILLFWVALLLDPQSFDPVAIRGFHLCFDDEVISLLYLGVQRSRDAMTFGASKTEALDGSPVPLGSTATHETTGLETLWIEKQSNPKQKNTSDNQQPSEGQAVIGRDPPPSHRGFEPWNFTLKSFKALSINLIIAIDASLES